NERRMHSHRRPRAPLLAGDLICLVPLLAPAEVRPPKRPATNTYHGVSVQDEYQWLENAQDPAVRKWSAAQNQQARGFLDKVPSRDGRLVAVSLSQNGSEDGTLHFYETTSGRALPDAIPGVQFPTGGGSAAWNADGSGIFYTRYPRKGQRAEEDLRFYQQVYF